MNISLLVSVWWGGGAARICGSAPVGHPGRGDQRGGRPLGGIFPANFLQVVRGHETLKELGASLALKTMAYVSSHRDPMMGKQVLRRLYPACTREKRAQEFVKF
jgi:hypothetical protein